MEFPAHRVKKKNCTHKHSSYLNTILFEKSIFGLNFILAIQIIGCATLTTSQKVEFSKSSYKPQMLDSQSNFLAENNFIWQWLRTFDSNSKSWWKIKNRLNSLLMPSPSAGSKCALSMLNFSGILKIFLVYSKIEL